LNINLVFQVISKSSVPASVA